MLYMTYSVILVHSLTKIGLKSALNLTAFITNSIVFTTVDQIMICMNLYMISIVVTQIEDQIGAVQQGEAVQLILAHTQQAVLKFQRARTGLKPLLFLLIVGLATNMLIMSYTLFQV